MIVLPLFPFSVPWILKPEVSRLGGRGAITATARKLARLVYRMLKFGTEYVTQSLAEYESQIRAKLERSLRRKARSLGYELVPVSAPSPPPP